MSDTKSIFGKTNGTHKIKNITMSDTKELSKEEILDKHTHGRDYTLQTLHKTMQEYADQEKKKEAIAFYEFAQKNNWKKYQDIDRWTQNGKNPKTFDEVFEIYKQSK